MSGGPRSYTFRISAEGMAEFVQDLQRAAGASDAAHQVINRLVQSSTDLSSALVRQQEATDRAARRAAEMARENERLSASAQTTGERIRSNTATLEAMEGRAQGARRAVSDLRGAMELLGAGGVAGALGPVAGLLGNIADAFGTGALAAGRLQGALGGVSAGMTAIASFVAMPVFLQSLGLGITTVGDSTQETARRQQAWQGILDGINDRLLTQEERLRRAAEAARTATIETMRAEAGFQSQLRGTDYGNALNLGPQLARARQDAEAAQRRLDDFNRLAEGNPRLQIGGAGALDANVARTRAEVERLERQLGQYNSEIDRRTAEIERVRAEMRLLQGTGIYSEPAGPNQPARPAAAGGRPGLSDEDIAQRQRARIDATIDAQTQAERRARDQREAEDRRSQERQAAEEQRRNEATAREWSRGLADATFAGLQAGFGRGEGVVRSFARVLGNVVQRSLANVLAEQVFMPVVSGFVGGGGAGGAAGGAGGLSSLLSGGGMLGNAGSLLSSGAQFLGFGGFGGGAGIASGINGFAASMFPSIFTSTGSANIASAASLAATTPEALMAALPAGPTSAMGTSFLGSLGPMAGGFAAGSFLGSLVAGRSQARQTNAMIGAGLGALAFGPFGGIAGGVIGGLIGPGPKTDAYGFSLETVNGQFGAGGLQTTGNGNGGDQALAQAQAYAEQVNAFLRANRITVADTNRVINGQTNSDDQSATFNDAFRFFRFSGRSGTSVATALSGRSFDSPEALSSAVEWVTNTYDALAEISRPTDQFAKGLEALRDSFEDAITKAKEYGLATDVLVASQAKATEQAYLQREVTQLGSALSRSRILGDFLTQQQLTTGSAQSQFGTARQQFEGVLREANAAGLNADLSRVVSAAGTLRAANANFNGAGLAGAGVEGFIRQELTRLGASQDLPSFAADFDASITRNTNRTLDASEQLRQSLESIKAELLNQRLALATAR